MTHPAENPEWSDSPVMLAARQAHMFDLYNALGVRWGDDPFVVITGLRARPDALIQRGLPPEELVKLAAQTLCSLDRNVAPSRVEAMWGDGEGYGHYYVMARAVLALRGLDAGPPPPDTLAMLEKATVRLEILAGRMGACSGDHALSHLEIPGWVEEQREFVAAVRAYPSEGEPAQ